MTAPTPPTPPSVPAARAPRARLVGVGVASLAALGIAVVVAVGHSPAPGATCGRGFFPRGARCCAAATGPCGGGGGDAPCPAPLTRGPRGCVGAPRRVAIPETDVLVGPSDWEAEGRVAPRRVHTARFWLDAFEAQVDELACPTCLSPRPALYGAGDPGRAMGGLDLATARAYCAAKGGRLPTDDEWLVAAGGARPRRYPWGDTGAVCRRGAWGTARGPCVTGADGPDTVGAHVDGDTELGVHDLAGNVAEWVATPSGQPRLRGGSFATSLATELRTWAARDVGPEARDDAGVRCAYDAALAP